MVICINIRFVNSFYKICPGQDVERYPIGVRLDNQKVLFALDLRTKYFERFCRSIKYNYFKHYNV